MFTFCGSDYPSIFLWEAKISFWTRMGIRIRRHDPLFRLLISLYNPILENRKTKDIPTSWHVAADIPIRLSCYYNSEIYK